MCTNTGRHKVDPYRKFPTTKFPVPVDFRIHRGNNCGSVTRADSISTCIASEITNPRGQKQKHWVFEQKNSINGNEKLDEWNFSYDNWNVSYDNLNPIQTRQQNTSVSLCFYIRKTEVKLPYVWSQIYGHWKLNVRMWTAFSLINSSSVKVLPSHLYNY